MIRILLLLTVLFVIGLGFSCSAASTSGATPTEAYKLLYAAVKSKDIEAIKKQLTKKSIEFGAMAAQKNNTPLEKVYENGFTGTTFSETLPPIRDERVNGDMGAVEVWNAKEKKWEDLPFIKEDGSWKLAVGEMFAGTYNSPGPGQDILEKQATNTVTNSSLPPAQVANAPIPVIKNAPMNIQRNSSK